MSRLTLLALQVLVAIAAIAIWQFFTHVPINGRLWLDPFFFSRPFDVVERVWRWFVTGTVWIHLGVTLVESMPPGPHLARAYAKIGRAHV